MLCMHTVYSSGLPTLKACVRADKQWDKDTNGMEWLVWEVTADMRTMKFTKTMKMVICYEWHWENKREWLFTISQRIVSLKETEKPYFT